MNDSQQTYRSAIGKGSFLIVALLVIVISLTQYFIFSSVAAALLAGSIVGLFFIVLYLNINYQLAGHQLKVSSLFVSRKIDIFQISSLQQVSSYLQQPFAFSEKRLRIIYNYGDYIDISPQKAEGLLDSLLAVNPMIQCRREPSLQE